MAAQDARSLLTHDTPPSSRCPRSAGVSDIIRMVGDLKSEWWAPSDQSAGRLHVGIAEQLTSEFAARPRIERDRRIVMPTGSALAPSSPRVGWASNNLTWPDRRHPGRIVCVKPSTSFSSVWFICVLSMAPARCASRRTTSSPQLRYSCSRRGSSDWSQFQFRHRCPHAFAPSSRSAQDRTDTSHARSCDSNRPPRRAFGYVPVRLLSLQYTIVVLVGVLGGILQTSFEAETAHQTRRL
jgi:hypothetical protein